MADTSILSIAGYQKFIEFEAWVQMAHLLLRGMQRLTRLPAAGRFPAGSINNCYANSNHQSLRSFQTSSRRLAVKPYILADIGEGITECQIIAWFVQPGDRVQQFDRICEVQSDKASVEITSRFGGTIKALHYGTDDMAIVGQPLLDIDIEGGTSEGEELLAQPPMTKNQQEEFVNAEHITKDKIEQTAKPQEPRGLRDSDVASSELSSPTGYASQQLGKQAGLVTPAIRHMLKKLNIDVSDIQGTGKDGRVMKEDVQRYISAISTPSTATHMAAPKIGADDRLVSLTATENQMFKITTRSLSIPHFLYTHSADFTLLNSLRKKFNANTTLSSAVSSSNCPTSKLTPLPFILKALSHAFMQFPTLNSHLDTDSSPDKPQLLIKASHNFGIAVDTPQGLLVPVVRDVQNHSIVSLAAEITRLSNLAKEGWLGVDDFKGATFTISNIGSIGGSVVSPVIVSPMVGILGVGRIQEVPVFQKDEQNGHRIVKREQVTLSWSADHRILDGATVAKCAKAVCRLLENIEQLGILLK